jgi:hypothetical protein
MIRGIITYETLLVAAVNSAGDAERHVKGVGMNGSDWRLFLAIVLMVAWFILGCTFIGWMLVKGIM